MKTETARLIAMDIIQMRCRLQGTLSGAETERNTATEQKHLKEAISALSTLIEYYATARR